MVKRTVFAALCAAGLAAQALAYITFPNADKSYDIYSAAAWGDTAYPTTSDTILINEKNATYTFSQDMTFGFLYFNGANMKIDLTSTPGRKITLSNSGSCFYPYSDGKSLELAGGYYYASNGGKLICITTTKDMNPNTSITLSSGVIVTNAGSVHVKNGPRWGTGPALKMKGGAKLYANAYDNYYPGAVDYTFTGDPTELGVSADIADGAQLVILNSIATGGGVMLVRGEGTLVKTIPANGNAGNVTVGSDSNNVVHVTDNAQFLVAGTLITGNSRAVTNSCLFVDDGGYFEAGGTTYMGSYGQGSGFNNSIIAGPGGTFCAKGRTYVYGTNNCIVASNGTVQLRNSLSLGGKQTDRGCTLKLYGPSAVLEFTNYASFLASGSGHRFILDGGATYSTSSSLYMSTGTSDVSGAYTSNTVEIVNGSHLTMTDSIWMRNYAGDVVAANGNTVRVASGGELTCKALYVYCADNTVVVSNGTLTCSHANGLHCGDQISNKDGTIVVPTTGARVILEGETPLVRSTDNGSTAYFRDGTKVIFRPSPNGFTTSAALMSFGTYSTDGTASLVFEGLEEVRKNLDHTVTYTLAEARYSTGKVAFTDEQLAAAEGLVDGCRLYKSADGKLLLLRIRANRGTVFAIR